MRSLFTRFEVRSRLEDATPDALIDEIANACWDWVIASDWVDSNRIPKTWEEGDFNQNDTDSMSVRDQRGEGVRFWRMDRREWGRERSGLRFDHYIFVVSDGEKVEFSVLQDIVHQKQRIGPHEEDIFPPSIIGYLVSNFDCNIEGESISGSWDSITPSETLKFVQQWILDPSRRLPVVVLSKSWESGMSIIGGAGRLSRQLSGLAHVVILSSRNVSHDRFFGEQWVNNGSIRIFWPGATKEGLMHKGGENLYTVKEFEEDFNSDPSALLQTLVNRISNATSTLQASKGLVDEVRTKIEEEESARERENSNRAMEQALSELNSASERLSFFENEAERLRGVVALQRIEAAKQTDKHTKLENRILSMGHQIQVLSDQNTDLRKFEKAVFEAKKRDPEAGIRGVIDHLNIYGMEVARPVESDEQIFGSVGDAFEKAREDFSARIKFLDSARASANEVPASSNVKPSKVYEIFEKLYYEIWPFLKKASENDVGGNEKTDIHRELSDCFGDMYAGTDSRLTRDMYNKWRDKNGRCFKYSKDTLIRLIPHIKLGNKVRIHLVCIHSKSSKYEAWEMYSDNDGKIRFRPKKIVKSFPMIVVGWCGKHLPNARLKG